MKKPIKTLIHNLSFQDTYDLITLSAALCGLLYSYALLSFSLVFLAVRVLFVGNMREKWQKISDNRCILIAFLSFFALHLISLLWTNDLKTGWLEVNHKLPFLIVPVALCVMSPVKKNEVLMPLFVFYLLLLFFGTMFATFRYVFDANADVRTLIPFANTIRFGINIAFSVALICIYLFSKPKNKWAICIFLLLGLWFIVFLFMIQALTGIVILCVLSFVMSVIMVFRRRTKTAYTLATLLIMALIIFIFAVRKEYKEYFTPKPLYTQPLKTHTHLGNPYVHLKDNYIENGCYVNEYLCNDEMIKAFERRTGLKLTDDCSQSPQEVCTETLKRYLNSKGLKKDEAGVLALTDEDITNIRNGNANYIYAKRFSLKPRLYQTFFEFERYFDGNGSFKNSSLTQRWELILNGLRVIGHNNLLIGTGTGDNINELKAEIDRSPHRESFNNHDPHNYYVYIFVQFGLLGLGVLLFFLFYPPTKKGLWRNNVFLSLFVIMISGMLVESLFNLFSMMMLYCIVCCILLFNDYEF
ncbi:MAG: O-antigen ligase family protein [Bacteroidales bacterium]|jgi:hypothetical protein|nr:O-antigen ligase family protein [Bacteroidales bacterium]